MTRRTAGGPRLMLEVVRGPGVLRTLDPSQWEMLLRQADASRLLGRLVTEADALGVARDAPAWLADRLAAARAVSRESERAVSWEIARLGRAFLGYPYPWVLLKGAAYVAAALPPARGRRVADLDVLVPFDGLEKAEEALREHGWLARRLNAYDERYYREWMHELPPLVHERRRSVIDLHHAILPRTSRLQPDSRALLDAAVPAGTAHVLSPAHMVIHAAVHLFHDGEIAGAARDLVDLDGLLRHFSAEVDFWPALVREAEALGVSRPVFYALRYTERLLDTPVPRSLASTRRAWAPAPAVTWLMDVLVEQTLAGDRRAMARLSAYSLYVRSHWLRMPPLMLARHLAHKAVYR